MPANFTLRPIALILFLLIVFSGCKKQDPPVKSKRELITSAPWKFSRVGLDTNRDGIIDTALRRDLVPVCYTDNLYTFSADSTGLLDENINNCQGAPPVVSPFSWYFLNNEQEFYMSTRILPVVEGALRIVELSEERFVLTKEVGVHGFPNYLPFVIILVH
jgi:hypothetical protein